MNHEELKKEKNHADYESSFIVEEDEELPVIEAEQIKELVQAYLAFDKVQMKVLGKYFFAFDKNNRKELFKERLIDAMDWSLFDYEQFMQSLHSELQD